MTSTMPRGSRLVVAGLAALAAGLAPHHAAAATPYASIGTCAGYPRIDVRDGRAPTGIAVDSAGRPLIVEDRNRTLLMLTRDSR